jgi:NADPH-dependent 2,4-dienoyl-CoA reductase/sulfur reductase-like enzyme
LNAKTLSRVVVVGGSLAGIRAASTLREEGFAGTLVVVGSEPHHPYDRPPLSKQFLAGKWGEPRIELLGSDKLEALDIELHLGVSAVSLDPKGRTVALEDGTELPFDKAIVATGSHPRMLRGVEETRSIMTLRTLDDSRRLATAIGEGKRLVVVGGGFIGSEVAATANQLGTDVTVLEALPVPLGRVLGADIGAACAGLHERHGVTVRTNTGVSSVKDLAGGGASVILDSGERVDADVVVVGIGIVPTTDWLDGSGLEVDDGLVVDSTLHATDEILAAGDVARWADTRGSASSEKPTVRSEHWTNAAEQGVLAAHNLLAGRAEAEPYRPIPYIWSDQYDTKIQVLGDPGPEDTVEVVDGSFESGRFVAIYGKEGKLAAAVGFGRPRQLMGFRQLLEDRASFDDALSLLES